MGLAELRKALGSTQAALASGTTVNSRHIAAGEIGTITPGARADVLVMAGDPTADLAALRAWQFIFASGHRYDRTTVDAWIETDRRHLRGDAYDAVTGTIVSLSIERFEHGLRGLDARRGTTTR